MGFISGVLNTLRRFASKIFGFHEGDLYTRSLKKMVFLILFVLFVTAIVGLVVFILLGAGARTVVVPDVVGKDLFYALVNLQEKNLFAYVDGKFTAGYPKGTVVEQYPGPGSVVRENRVVRIIVSLGEETMTVPDVVGMTETEARAVLRAKGIRIGRVVRISSDSIPSGKVMGVNPPVGTKIEKGFPVELLVSSGVAGMEVSVDDYKGKAVQAVYETLSFAGLRPVLSEKITTNQTQDGVVVDQSATPGSTLMRGEEIILTVAVYSPDPEESETHYYAFNYIVPGVMRTGQYPFATTSGEESETNEERALEEMQTSNQERIVRILVEDADGKRVVFAKSVKPSEKIPIVFKARGKVLVSIEVNGNEVAEITGENGKLEWQE